MHPMYDAWAIFGLNTSIIATLQGEASVKSSSRYLDSKNKFEVWPPVSVNLKSIYSYFMGGIVQNAMQ